MAMTETASAPATAAAPTPAAAPPARAHWFRRLLRDRAAALALVVLAALILAAALAPWIAPHDPFANSRSVMTPPAFMAGGNPDHWLGTDGQGRDILSRLLFGTRLTLTIGFVAVVIGGGLGSLIGLLSAFYPRLDPWVMRGVDILLSFPAILLGLALVAVMGQGTLPVILALAVSSLPDCARIARGIAIGVMKQEYIEAGRAVGLSDFTLFHRYLLRNCISSVMIFLSLRFGQIILIGATLSFLGLGAQPPQAELGMMAAQGRDFLLFAPHIAVIPSLVIFITVLAANMAGDALRDVLDPRFQA
ncbi:ABC transporter permease [Frigidibacter sp. MR17.24]|uniref:ABC transporter permease n=1 Tax=Frigidibacter sp. MR17.24 TaxID=3127345 RepID=UPI003012B815